MVGCVCSNDDRPCCLDYSNSVTCHSITKHRYGRIAVRPSVRLVHINTVSMNPSYTFQRLYKSKYNSTYILALKYENVFCLYSCRQ